MNIMEFCTRLQLELEVTGIFDPYKKKLSWLAQIHSAEIKEHKNSPVLVSFFGIGKTPQQAIRDYSKKIQGQFLVVDTMGQNRQTYSIPSTLTY